MRLVLTLIAAGLGIWLWKEVQHGQELQYQLDEAKKELEAYQQQQQAQNAVRAPQPGQWMYSKDPNNPLNFPATRVGRPQAAPAH